MSEKKKVLVAFIQDRSGSMATGWGETVNGYREFLKELKAGGEKDGVDYVFSLTTFDTQIDTPVVGKPISETTGDELANFGPRGNTALYDAAGVTIDSISKNRHGAEKIICVIVTDGEENSSREWKKDTLNKAIDEKLNQGDWTFTYLGTQPETWGDSMGIGVGLASTATFNQAMSGQTYSTVAAAAHSHSVSNLRGTRSLYADYAARDDSHQHRMAAAKMSVKVDAQVPVVPPQPNTVKFGRITKKPAVGKWR